MTHRSGGKGTFLLDRIFPGLGRVKRASGTQDRRTFDALNAMLSQLWAGGRTDVLARIRDGDLHPLEVWGRVREGGMQDLPNSAAIERFDTTWIDAMECSEGYQTDLRNKVKRFTTATGVQTLADLPAGLAVYRGLMSDTPVMFNRTKAALQGFLHRRFGQHHPLWMALSNVPSLKEDPKHGNPQTVEQLTALTVRMEKPYARIAWSMALTGMGPKEYWGKWRVLSGIVEIGGTKTKGRQRHVPLLGEIHRPTVTMGMFADALEDVNGGAVKPYDLRRTFAVWCDLAGVDFTHIRLYLGHRAQSVTERYLWREVMRHIPADAKKVRAWLASERKAVKRA